MFLRYFFLGGGPFRGLKGLWGSQVKIAFFFKSIRRNFPQQNGRVVKQTSRENSHGQSHPTKLPAGNCARWNFQRKFQRNFPWQNCVRGNFPRKTVVQRNFPCWNCVWQNFPRGIPWKNDVCRIIPWQNCVWWNFPRWNCVRRIFLEPWTPYETSNFIFFPIIYKAENNTNI